MPKLIKFRKLFPIKQELFDKLNVYDLYNKENNEFNTLISILQTKNNIEFKVIKLFREIDRIRNIKITNEELKLRLKAIQISYEKED
tara:strand:+ start:376 stop:636 length:261 start_codon:yes stop_codon:yes gene_type:complete